MTPFVVVILNDHASIVGGSASVAIASAVALAERGVKVTYFSCIGPVAAELHGVPNLDVVCLGDRDIAGDPNRLRAFVGGWRNSRAERALQALLATKSPECTLVHAHGWTKALSPFALAAVTRMGFRLIATLHDFFIACPSGGLFVHRTRSLCSHRPLSLGCWSCNCDRRNYAHKLWRGMRTVLQNHVLRLPSQIAHYIAVSEFSLDILRPYLPPEVPVSVVRNPLGARASRPLESDCGRDARAPRAVQVAENRRFVYVGRIETEKGAGLFAEAATMAGVEGVLIGDGAMREELQQQFPHLRFTGWLSRDAIRCELRAARALVFPPLWYETLGLVVLEAAAEGVPAIVANRCAAIDIVREGENGLHFMQGSAESLARQLSMLARNDAMAARLGAEAYEVYWRQPWTPERHAEDLLRVYRSVAGSGRQTEETWHERAGGVRAGS